MAVCPVSARSLRHSKEAQGEGGVYEVHDWAEVHRLFHREERTKKQIAEELGMSLPAKEAMMGAGLSRDSTPSS